MSDITSDQVRALFDYADGKLLWIGGNPNAKHKGIREAGTINSEGYVVVTIGGKKHHAHKLVWLWHGLTLPEQIDHIDGDRMHNRIENLRASSRASNGWNSKLSTANKSGVKGVSWCNTYRKWVVQIYRAGKKTTGRFKELDDAVAFARAKRAELHGEFACEGR